MKIQNINIIDFRGISFDKETKGVLKPIEQELSNIAMNNNIKISEQIEHMGIFTSKNIIMKIAEQKVVSNNPIKNLFNNLLGATHPSTKEKVVTKCVAQRENMEELIFELKEQCIFEYAKNSLKNGIATHNKKIVYKNLKRIRNIFKIK